MIEALAGLLVGLMVGVTGVGGGSLMAPIMILLLGVSPVTAIGTDLWFAAITKTVGGSVHSSRGSTDWKIVRHLAYGSIPAAALTLIFLALTGASQIEGGFIINALGAVLILTALATLFRHKVQQAAIALRQKESKLISSVKPTLIVICGAILGVMVTLTSVGAGALGATMLIMLYPRKLSMKKIVGTDITHAVPLTFLAGLGHLWLGNVDFSLLMALLIGSIPGIIIGSLMASFVPEKLLKMVLSILLVIVGVRMLF